MKSRLLAALVVSAIFAFGGTCSVFAEDIDEEQIVLEEKKAKAVLSEEPTMSVSDEALPKKTKQKIKTPVKLYGVATGAKSFRLNAKAKTELTYKSSNPSVAKVSAKGVVTVRKKEGIAKITIRAKSTKKYASAKKVVKVRVSKYKKPCGKILQSAGNMDGRLGDSSGREVAAYPYVHGKAKWKNWCFVIQCTDPYISNHAARAFEHIAENNNFGHQARDPKSQKSIDLRASTYKVVRSVVGKNPS